MALSEKQKSNLKINIPIWIDLLMKNDVSPEVIPFILAQMILETGWFSSDAYKIDNNPAGVTWNNNYKTRTGTTIGIQRKEGGNYVHFDNYQNAVVDYIRILNRKSKPIEAKDINDFANRLAKNGYYEISRTPVAQYTKTLNSVYNRIQQNVDVATLLQKKKRF